MSTVSIRCLHCGFVVTAAPAATLQHQQCPQCRGVIPVPPIAATIASPLPASPPLTAATADEQPEEEPRSWSLEIMLAAVLVVILALALGIALVWRQRQAQSYAGAHVTVVDPVKSSSSAPKIWSSAADKSLAMNDIVVSIPGVQFGPVRGKDGEKYFIVNNEHLLQIRLKIVSYQSAPRTYHSWYTNQFKDHGQATQALLYDSHGNQFAPHVIRTQELLHYTPQAELERRVPLGDMLIFQLPPESEPDRVQYYRLELPAAAYGGSGYYRFEIPRTMVEREISLTD